MEAPENINAVVREAVYPSFSGAKAVGIVAPSAKPVISARIPESHPPQISSVN
jgi:hypothetical protein